MGRGRGATRGIRFKEHPPPPPPPDSPLVHIKLGVEWIGLWLRVQGYEHVGEGGGDSLN